MNKNLKIVLFGFLVWLVPFLVSFVVFPLKESNRALFESIMPLVLTVVVTTLAYYYLKNINSEYLKNGLIIGGVWYIVSIVIDLCMFMPASPMHMSLGDYMMDIGLTYFIIPVITVGMALIAQNKAAE
jgi:hypothetical protein